MIFLVYAPAVRAPFELDDVESIVTNPTIRTLWPLAVPLHPPGGDLAVSGRPAANYSLAVNYALNEALGVDQRPAPEGSSKSAGYHVVNLLLHLLCGLALFGVLRRTMRGEAERSEIIAAEGNENWFAAIVAGLWLIHPLESEVVNYVVQRTESLAALCYLGTLYASIRAWWSVSARERLRWSAIAVAACALGMASKEIMLTAPLIVVLYDLAFHRPTWAELRARRRLPLYAALIATSAISIVLIATGARGRTVGFHLGIPWYEYLYTQAWAIGRYLCLFLWPDRLTFDYGQGLVHGFEGLPGLALLLAFGVATVVAWTKPQWRWFGFLGAWFFLILAPSSSILPIRTETAAERRIYLSIVPVIVLTVLGAAWFRRRFTETAPADRRRLLKIALGIVALCYFAASGWTGERIAGAVISESSSAATALSWAVRAVIALAASGAAWMVLTTRSVRRPIAGVAALLLATTAARSYTYADAERLWQDTVRKVPGNPRAYDNLAAAMLQRDPAQKPAAESLYRKAIALDSTYVPAWYNLAEMRIEQGDVPGGIVLLRRILQRDPDLVSPTERLSAVLLQQGDTAGAVPYLERLAAQFPSIGLLGALSNAYTALDRPADVVRVLRRADQLYPGQVEVLASLADALQADGHPTDAIPYLERAVAAAPESPELVARLAIVYAQSGRAADATQAANLAAARGGNNPGVYLLAGRALLLLERPRDAVQYFERARELAPNNPEVLTRLGLGQVAAGQVEQGAQSLRRALTIQPGYGPAERALNALRTGVRP